MSARRALRGAALLLLIAAALAGLWLNREPSGGESAGAPQPPQGPAKQGQVQAAPGRAGARPRERTVDTRPLLTARRLFALAGTPEEVELARQAERLADHAVDLAFADALRQAAENPPPPTPELKALLAARDRAEAAVAADRQQLGALEDAYARAKRDDERDRLQDQAEVARAQVELDQDELDQASEALARAGGDPQAKIKRLRTVYEAAQKEARLTPPAEEQGREVGSVIARVRAWRARRAKQAELLAAQREALDRVQRIGTFRAKLAERIRAEGEAREQAKRSASGFAQGGAGAADTSKEAALAALRHFTEDQRRLTVLDRRIQDLKDLGDTYGEWLGVVDGQLRVAQRRTVAGLLWVVLTVLAVMVVNALIDRGFHRMERGALRKGTLRAVIRFAVQAVGLLVVLFIVVGTPGQLTTILGLAGAGLTVALKDFIVAFFGWFILMRKNGIRVGDWVEIKGVGGEVAEIGLLHTVLLETGSWTGAGHPTGRRVSFVNSFAIEGHYFNFSTSGQWMWDELRVLIPTGQDPYPVLDGVQKLVEQETQANAKQAEQEWQTTTSRYRVRTFSAVPGINVVPGPNGVELDVRYITRAYERHEARRRLYHAIVELMHGRRAGNGTAPAAAGGAGAAQGA